ncbi:MAG: hypothetical protein EPO10_17700 [Reyranella sp.]|uniref:hypothetical protein n=1 Tax=Reyranella sp. TaxID=1929291 RepID=UPI00120C7BBC|nr:MAG: hypothetical protein EPO41_04055 [Reyranella sp.]TBR27515.1 MAG: hypothetical protein EPO10_17700 [Reyranella sp.]
MNLLEQTKARHKRQGIWLCRSCGESVAGATHVVRTTERDSRLLHETCYLRERREAGDLAAFCD